MDKYGISKLQSFYEALWFLLTRKSVDKILEDEGQLFEEIGKLLYLLRHNIDELNVFLDQMARGELHVTPPPSHNLLAGSAKALWSNLNHLAWQTNQIKTGDYSQGVNDMGVFFDAFNHMGETLKERENGLKEEILKREQATSSLTDANKRFLFVLSYITDIVLVVHENEIWFINKAGESAFPNVETLDCLNDVLLKTLLTYRNTDETERTFEMYDDVRAKHYAIRSVPMKWLEDKDAYLQVATDITEIKAKEAALSQIAFLDELTGISNRRAGFARLAEILENTHYYPICICYIDIDKLKYVNDHLGHHFGDLYIKTVAQVIASSIRGDDFVSRMGGDEFLVILTRVDQEAAQSVIRRVDARLNALSNQEDTPFQMAISFGVTEITEKVDKTAETYIIEADKRMYNLKNERRKLAQQMTDSKQ